MEHIVSRGNATYVNNILAVVVSYGSELLPVDTLAGVSAPNSPHPTRSQKVTVAKGVCSFLFQCYGWPHPPMKSGSCESRQ